MSRPWKFKKGDQMPAWVSGGSYIEGLQFGDDVTLIENTTDGGFFVIGGSDQDATADCLIHTLRSVLDTTTKETRNA